MSNPILPLIVWPEGILQARIPANDNALRIEAMSRPCLGVANDESSPADGDVWIVGDTPSGAFAAFDENDIALYRSGWHAWAPVDGVLQVVAGVRKVYVGGSTNSWEDDPSISGGGAVDSVNGQTGTVQIDAEDVPYDNSTSGLSATDVQGAVDELEGLISGGGMANPMTTAGDIIIGGTSGAPTRLAAGTNTYVLTMVSGAPAWAAGGGGGGGLTNWTDGVNTSAPNDTVPVVSLAATNAATNVDAAITAKGTGATVSQVADNSTAGGNKRGTYATDWQKSRSSALQVASGTYSVIGGGRNNTASGSDSVVAGGTNNTASEVSASVGGGANSTASANYSTVAGGQQNAASGMHAFVGGGFNNVAGGAYSFIAGGVFGSTLGLNSVGARASGRFNSNGDAQSMCAVLRRSTADATPGTMTHAGGTGGTTAASATNQLVLSNNSAYVVKATVVVRENSTGDTAAWDVTFCIKRGANAASTTIVGTAAINVIGADAGATVWALDVTADTTLGCPKFEVTGEASHSLKWVADVYSCVQVVG